VYHGNRNRINKETSENVFSRESNPGLLVTAQMSYLTVNRWSTWAEWRDPNCRKCVILPRACYWTGLPVLSKQRVKGISFPCIRQAAMKLELNNQHLVRRKNLYHPDVTSLLAGKTFNSGHFSHWRPRWIFTKRPQTITDCDKWEIWNITCLWALTLALKRCHPRPATRSLSGRVASVLV